MNLVLPTLQRLVQILLALFVGLVAVAFMALFSTRQLVNDQLRAQIAMVATETSGLAISVGRVRGAWWSGLTLEDVLVHETDSPHSGVLVSVPIVQVDYSVMSFFGRRPRPIRVDAYHPALTAVVGRDHQLRFKPKAKPIDPNPQPAPPVDIVIHAGHVAYDDQGARKPFVAELTSVSGQGRLRGFDLDLDLQALRDGDTIRAHVDYSLKDLRGSVQAKAQGLRLPYFVNRFGYAPEYELTAGRADLDVTVAWRDPVTPKMDTVSLGGTVKLYGGEATLKNVAVPVKDLSGDVTLKGDKALVRRAEGRLAGMPLEVTGVVDRVLETQPRLMMPDPILQLSVVAPEVALEQLSVPFPGIKDLKLSGQGAIQARVSGTSADPRVAMTGFVPSGHYGKEPVKDFFIAADYRKGALDIPAWRLRVAGGQGAGDAWVGLPEGDETPIPYRVKGRFANADVAELLARHAPTPPAVAVTGKAALGFTISGVGARGETHADLAVTSGTLAGRPVERFSARYHHRDARWDVPELTLDWAGTSLSARLNGTDAGAIEGHAKLTGARLDELLAMAPEKPTVAVTGRLSGEATLRGQAARPETWRATARLALADGMVDRQRIDRAELALSLADNRVTVSGGRASAFGGTLTLRGEASPVVTAAPDALAAHLHLTARGLDPARVAGLPSELRGLETRADGDFELTLAGGAWRAAGTARTAKVVHPAWGHLDGLQATLTADERQLTLAPLTWRQGQARVTAAGTVTLGQRPRWDLRVATRDAEIATLLGAVDWPRISLALDPRAAETRRASGPTRERAALPARPGPIQEALVQLRPGLDHWLAYRKTPLDRPAPAPALLPFWEGTRGKLTLDAHLTGPVDRPSVTLEARAEGLDVFDRHLDTAELGVGWAADRLTVSRLRVREGGRVVLTGGGALGQSPADALVLHSHGLDLGWSRRALAPHKMRLDGRGDVELRVRGPWSEPKLSARGELSAGSFVGPGLEPIAFERLTAELAYTRGQLDIRRAILRQGGREAMVAGTLPVAEGTRGSTAPIDLAVRLEDGNLAIANLFSQGRFQWLGGTGFVELRLGGTPLHPTLAGQIKLRDGRLAAKGLDAPVEKLEADVTLADDKVRIETLKGTYGGGDLELGGEITLSEFQPQRVDLTAVARPFRLQLTNDYYQGMVEADLKLKGPIAQPQLSGMVALRDGLITLKDSPKPDQGPPKEPNPLRLDNLQIALGPNLRIKNALIDLNVTTQQRQGFLQVDGPIAAPKPYGVVIIEGGTIRPLNNTFKITEGRVEFFGEQVRTEDELMAILAPDAGADPTANLNAKLDIFARTTLFDYEENEPIDIQAHVTGSLQQMDMRFTSEPIRPQQELLDMLSKKQVLAQTFNGKLDGGQVIVKEVGGLVTSNIEELISPYTLFLRNALSLQTFRVELVPDYEKDSTANIAGFKPALTVETRPLLERFSVGSRLVVGQLYDTSPTTLGDHTYVGLNWRFNRHLAVQYRVDPYVDQLNQRLLNQTLGLKAQFSY